MDLTDSGSRVGVARACTALQFAKLGLANAAINPVRFCWWGAEEIGLLGSRYHVRQAKANGDILRYALYLNYDMLGSPNYIIQVLATHRPLLLRPPHHPPPLPHQHARC